MPAQTDTFSNRLAPALKDAAVAGLIALALTSVIIGMRTYIVPGGLAIQQRWGLVAIAVGSVFVGRLFLTLFVFSRLTRYAPAGMRAIWSNIRGKTAGLGIWGVSAILLFAVVMPFLPFSNRYIIDIGILVLTYIMLGWGLNIVVGLAGLLDLGYVAFYAVGAYSFALIATNFGWNFWVCLPLAGLFSAFFGLILGFPVLRLRGDYLAIVTLAFGEMVRIILTNWFTLTGGPNGISGIPRPSFFGLPFKRLGDTTFHGFFGLEYSPIHRIIFLYYVILALALITNFITLRLRKLPIGRAWEALREDEIACRSLGINTTNTKLTAFAIGAMFGGFAGSFFATRQGFISPESFVFLESALILAIVVLGGMGSQIGVVIAATAMIGGFELFRDLQEYRMLVFGMAMVSIMVWRPRGLIATRKATIELNPKPRTGLFGKRNGMPS